MIVLDRFKKMMKYNWAWSELQKLDPEPQDLAYIASVVPRGSNNHLIAENKVNKEIGKPYTRGVYYPTLIKLLAVAVNAF